MNNGWKTLLDINQILAVSGGAWWLLPIGMGILLIIIAAIIVASIVGKKRKSKDYERALKMTPMLIHLPPSTDDIQGGGRDARDVANEAISAAQIMYSIVASTLKKKNFKTRVYGQRHFSFEMMVVDGFVKYYVVVPAVLRATVKQAVLSSYPAARLEEKDVVNIFPEGGSVTNVAGGELILKKEFFYPIATYEDTKWDGQTAILNAFSKVKQKEGLGLQILFRPIDNGWVKKANSRVQNIKTGKKSGLSGVNIVNFVMDIIRAPFEVPELHEKDKDEQKPLSQLKQDEIAAIENKTKFPAFECLMRVVASSGSKARSEMLVGGVVAAFAQFDSASFNGFKYDFNKNSEQLATDYIFRAFSQKKKSTVLNSMELATIFHLPSQSSIPNSGVERQATRQVDGPARLATSGLLLGMNEYRGEKKKIYLQEKDRRRHTYIIGATGMGKSVLMGNLAFQDMMDGRGFAFLDPHGDVVEDILSKVPPERIDDVVYFDPGNLDNPVGMNMFEWKTEDQKDFIVQEGINMLQSLYDPTNQGFFGPRGQHMFRNAALLLMSDPAGATFIDIPKAFIDPEFVKQKLKYVTDRNVYDYWTKEFPASQKSSDAGEVITWFASKWGPFLSNIMMRNILGQVKSGFNIREMMDQKKILLVNLSKGKMGEMNSKLLGMIFVMKFQAAAMSRVDTPEDERNDFCLYVDEFQNFSTDSFESILSEARKFRLNLIVANQFMTQLTDKIREGVLGNVGTFITGRVGVTDAEMLEKVFQPVFNAQDLHNQPNHHAIATVMMYDMPSSPFTMNLLPPMGERKSEILESLKLYSATKYGRPRAEVDKEIEARMGMVDAGGGDNGSKEERADEIVGSGQEKQEEKITSFLDSWMEKQSQAQEDPYGDSDAIKMATEALERLEKAGNGQDSGVVAGQSANVNEEDLNKLEEQNLSEGANKEESGSVNIAAQGREDQKGQIPAKANNQHMQSGDVIRLR